MVLMAVVGARATASCRTGKNTPKKTSRQGATTSSFFSYRNPSRPTFDKTGRHIAPNTGRRRTSAAPNFGKASALGSVRLREKKAAGSGGLGGGDGNARADSQGDRATSRRAATHTATVTVTAPAYHIQDQGDGGQAYSRLSADATEAILEAHHAAPHPPPTSTTASAQRKAANAAGATAQPALPPPQLPRARVPCAPPKSPKGPHKLPDDHNSRADRDRAQAKATCHGRARELVCLAMQSP
jgi:hypothetical protein